MKFVCLNVAIGVFSVAASAQEKTTPPPRVYPVALPNYDESTATRLQIFLDNSDFGPGKIDGRMGEFFRKALISYKHARAMPKTGAVDQWMLDQVPVTYTTYTIRDEDLKFIGDVPSSHAEQARLKWLPYTSLLEFVAERYHSAEAFIQKLNPGKIGNIFGQAKLSRCRMFCPLKLKSSRRAKCPKILRSPLAKFSSTRPSICWRSSTTISSSVFFQLRLDLKRFQHRWAHGKFSARLSGRGSATTKGCSTTACAPRTTTTCRRVRTISLGFSGWV